MTRLRYRIGGGLGGDTSVELGDDGRCRVESSVTRDRSRQVFEGDVGRPRFAELVALLDRHKVWDAAHVRKRAPGEASATFELDNSEPRAVTLWVSEVPDDEAFSAATAAVLALASEVSGGAVLEPGR